MNELRAVDAPRYKALGPAHIHRLSQLRRLSADQRLTLEAVSAVLPFRTNHYVLDQLVDWDALPDDPIWKLCFPQEGMLRADEVDRLRDLVRRDAPAGELEAEVTRIRARLNPHPAGQLSYNVPRVDGEPLYGMQHKYRETVLFFPSPGQSCHAYCTYCFRWAQFVGVKELRFAGRQADGLARYLRHHPEATDVLFTGGDPLVMRSKLLRRYVEPLLEIPSVRSVRIGTKSTSWWPYRFLTDPDTDDLLDLFEEVVDSGRSLALMAHYTHPRELEPEPAVEALRRIRSTGAVVRCQAPVVRHVNDHPDTWTELWRRQVELGTVPYYMFVARDTGPRKYFEVTLARALEIYQAAVRRVSGLARTVRGPSMSATPGKVLVDGIVEHRGEKLFALKMLQGRDPAWAYRLFHARFDPEATWLDQLRPPRGQDAFFYQPVMDAMVPGEHAAPWSVRTRRLAGARVGRVELQAEPSPAAR